MRQIGLQDNNCCVLWSGECTLTKVVSLPGMEDTLEWGTGYVLI